MVNPKMTVTPDGRVWFVTSGGVAGIDPGAIRANPVPPPVEIEDLVVDGKRTPFRGGEVKGRSLEVEYTALSLTNPEAVRFRYRLEPVNKTWVDAGSLRHLAYENLSPGRYRLRVTACNNDGLWNAADAGLAFTIEPRFYQTWWFAALAAASIGMAGFGLHRGRMSLMRSRFQLRLQERTRLARDMHDTLLQGFAGVVYQLEAASKQMANSPELGRDRLAKALEQADEALREARQMLSSLRLSGLENRTLAEALRAAGEQAVCASSIRFEFAVRGHQRELPYEVQASLFMIAREAMANAAKHASPSRILAAVAYTAETVILTVTDDGKGFDLEAAESRHDHWGLAGMRERARQAGGSLHIHSASGMGTTVEVVAK
jgi:signal transduction histidine kinase